MFSCLVIVNGQRNKVLLSVTNKEDVDYSVLAVSAKVSHPDNPDKILRNVSLNKRPMLDDAGVSYMFEDTNTTMHDIVDRSSL